VIYTFYYIVIIPHNGDDTPQDIPVNILPIFWKGKLVTTYAAANVNFCENTLNCSRSRVQTTYLKRKI